jgi:thioredoxin reductase (NADPH)
MSGSAVSRAPRVSHGADAFVAGDGAGFDYDLVVIGGGSGGLAASKEAASLGAKVAVLDFVKPSWQGSTWGLGGTCVNVGCIPKKLMHQATLLGEAIDDARAYGWDVPARASVRFDWNKLVTAVQDHISSLNFGYRVALRDAKVEYKNALGTFKDPHTLVLTDKKGKTSEVRARRIIVAVGGRPNTLDIPGGELAISSDDLFSLQQAPGKTLIVGASYIALECGGFLAGLGFDTTVLVRSILLRGFDTSIAEKIGDHMASHGVKFVRPAIPQKIEKLDSGKLKVSWVDTDTKVESSDVFDTVFVATGRYADTGKLGLDAAGVIVDKGGKLPTRDEQTNVSHIYAIGDVVHGKPELTPVAIHAGKLLARRLYGGSSEGMDYERIATTVFTPLEYGCVGLSEEATIEAFGAENVEFFHSSFSPLEWSVVETRPQNACYAKLCVHKADNNRVVGFHVLGPNAGEITQGWAAAVRMGATYESFCSTVGIHPTMSEEFTQLSVTKSSGEAADKGGC